MRFLKNVLWSFFGTGLPMVVAVVAIPRLLEAMGTARFGVLSLAWVVVGYFSLFDLGLGRALTQLIAQKLGQDRHDEIPPLVWAGMGLMAVLGIAGAAVLGLLSPWIVSSKLQIPPELRGETLTAFYLLALSIPLVIASTALRGILEAHQRFDVVNIVRAPLGVLTYLGPLAMLAWSSTLPAMVATLIAARALSFVVYLGVCLRLFPDLRQRARFRAELLRPLLSFGGWMTLSNIAAPLLLYVGRLALAVWVSAEAVAYFSTPYEVVINLLIIPGVFVSVLFPMFASQLAGDKPAVARLYGRALLMIAAIMLPLVVLTVAVARPAMAWWINPEFAEHGYRVAQIIAVGIFINSFGHLSQALVQAYGRPDLTAKLHVAELVVYGPYLYWLIQNHGVEGAAVAWVLRVTISTVALWILARRCLSGVIAKG